MRSEPACCSPHKDNNIRRRRRNERLEVKRFGTSFQLVFRVTCNDSASFRLSPLAENHQTERRGEQRSRCGFRRGDIDVSRDRRYTDRV